MALYAFDGTWNARDRKEVLQRVQSPQYGADASVRRQTSETNVHRFREFFGHDRSVYLEGVGTSFGLLGRIFGGMAGAGGKRRIRRMYRELCERYAKGDTAIDIVGFSRGAAMAVHFSNVIDQLGIETPGGPTRWTWPYSRLLGWTFRLRRPVRSAAAPRIRFLGLFDTVASFGVPIGPFRNRPTRRWQVTTIPGNVHRSFHAMALDEVRATFTLIRPARQDEEEWHYEVWFRGVHSNIGGGYLDRGLSDIALAWMLEMYLWTLDKTGATRDETPARFVEALDQLAPEPPPLPADWRSHNLETLEPDADGELGRPADMRRQGWRELPPDALVHHSVHRRTKNLLLDHRGSNRRLLRPLPGNARAVHDPPFFYGHTPRQQARQVALEAFSHIPVRAGGWLTVGGVPVVRSDDWVALGERRADLAGAKTRETFVAVAAEWLLGGRPPVARLTLPATFLDEDKTPVPGPVAAQWVVDVLVILEPYVPGLREYGR